MSPETLAFVSSIVSLAVGGAVTLAVQERGRRREEASRAADVVARYRDPLLAAAFDLQSRLYNIAAQGFLRAYLEPEGDAPRYAEASTLWLLGQYLGWVEILRRDIQFLDAGRAERTRQLRVRLEAVERELASDSPELGSPLRVFRAEQRAIGEIMSPRPGEHERPRTLGYAEFVDLLPKEPLARWYEPLATDVRKLAAAGETRLRLRRVQRALIDLIDELDPDRLRYPNPNVRGKLMLPQVGRPARRAPGEHAARFVVEEWVADPFAPFTDWAAAHHAAAGATASGRWATLGGGRLRRRLQVEVTAEHRWLTIRAWSAPSPLRRLLGGRTTAPIRPRRRRDRARRRAVNDLLARYDRPALD